MRKNIQKMKKYFMTTLFMLVVFLVLVTVNVRYTEKPIGYINVHNNGRGMGYVEC